MYFLKLVLFARWLRRHMFIRWNQSCVVFENWFIVYLVIDIGVPTYIYYMSTPCIVRRKAIGEDIKRDHIGGRGRKCSWERVFVTSSDYVRITVVGWKTRGVADFFFNPIDECIHLGINTRKSIPLNLRTNKKAIWRVSCDIMSQQSFVGHRKLTAQL